MTVRILLADGHPQMLESLRALIERQPGMQVVAEARNGQSALRLVGSFKPDVVVMDINMFDIKGAEAARQMASSRSGVKFLALSTYSNSEFVDSMFDAGATGYLLKDYAFEGLVEAIHTVAANRIYKCPGIEKNVAIESD